MIVIPIVSNAASNDLSTLVPVCALSCNRNIICTLGHVLILFHRTSCALLCCRNNYSLFDL